MTDDKLMLTEDDIKEFLEERHKNSSCPACGHPKWWILKGRTHREFAALPVQDKDKFGNFTLDIKEEEVGCYQIIPMECSNCGTMRLVGMHALAIWKAEKEKKEH